MSRESRLRRLEGPPPPPPQTFVIDVRTVATAEERHARGEHADANVATCGVCGGRVTLAEAEQVARERAERNASCVPVVFTV